MSSAGDARHRCFELPRHGGAVGDVVGRALIGRDVEGHSQIVGAEAVRADRGAEEVGAVRRGEDDVGCDERAGAEGGPLAGVDLDLQLADTLEPVLGVVGSLENRTGRVDQGDRHEECDRCRDHPLRPSL
jgi:hypothetical protein